MAGRGGRFHRALSGSRWERVRHRELERAGWRCKRCGRPGRLEIHHKQPLSRGGLPFDPSNLVVLCRDCHLSEHWRPLTAAEQGWRDLVRDLVKS